MSDKKERFRGESYRRQRSQEMRAGFAVPEFPEASRISVKTLGYLYAFCGLRPEEIAAKFPAKLTLADVFAGLSHYLRDRERIDAEIKRELAFNSGTGLSSASVSLPRVGLPFTQESYIRTWMFLAWTFVQERGEDAEI
jgi:uncharacterized protein (DUF433 family)